MSARRTMTRFMTPQGLLGLVCVAVVALTAACGSSPGSSPAPTLAAPPASAATAQSPSASMSGSASTPSSSAAQAVITIKDFAFDAPASVTAGATVTVVNNDTMSHTVTSTQKGAFDVTVAGGATGTFTAPAKSGTYDFVCSFHGNMKATLVVS